MSRQENRLVLDQREDGRIALYPRGYLRGPHFGDWPEFRKGDTIYLRVGQFNVMVQNVQTLPSGRFRGIVRNCVNRNDHQESIEPPPGIILDTSIEFDEVNIFMGHQ